MSGAAVIDVDQLVAAVPGGQPAGADLRYLPIFDEIKAARRAAEVEPGELGPWRKVADLATRASARSKDLQLGIWLLEAFARLDGFRGATAGLALTRRLLDDFWDSVYPQLDPDDADPAAYRRAHQLMRCQHGQLVVERGNELEGLRRRGNALLDTRSNRRARSRDSRLHAPSPAGLAR